MDMTHYAPVVSHWTGEEEEKTVCAVKAAGIKSKGSNGEVHQDYGQFRDICCPIMEAGGKGTPLTDIFASQEATKEQNCVGTGTRVILRGTNIGARNDGAM